MDVLESDSYCRRYRKFSKCIYSSFIIVLVIIYIALSICQLETFLTVIITSLPVPLNRVCLYLKILFKVRTHATQYTEELSVSRRLKRYCLLSIANFDWINELNEGDKMNTSCVWRSWDLNETSWNLECNRETYKLLKSRTPTSWNLVYSKFVSVVLVPMCLQESSNGKIPVHRGKNITLHYILTHI